MIASLTGTVTAHAVDSVVIDVGGVGFLVIAPNSVRGLGPIGSQVSIQTLLVVREDSLTLYGFADADERRTFELVTSVQGVGPKGGIATLNTMTPDAFRVAVATGDIAGLTRIPGIGKKVAQKIIFALADKIGSSMGADSVMSEVVGTGTPGWRDQVGGALIGLGWSAKEADSAIGAIEGEAAGLAEANGGKSDIPALLRLALRTMAR